MKQIRLIVSDLDNTLLNGEKGLSGYTVSVLERCRREGMMIAYATARPQRNTSAFCERFSPDGLVANNGARVLSGGEVVSYNPIPSEQAAALTRLLLDELGVILSLDCAEVSMTNHPDYLDWGNWGAEFTDFSDFHFERVEKMSVFTDKLESLKQISFERFDCRLIPSLSEPMHMIEHVRAGKWNGVLRLCEHFGIDPSEIVTFGDDFNDLPMLAGAGIGVAVDNACEAVRHAAKEHCPSHEEDGVARWLEKNLLGGI